MNLHLHGASSQIIFVSYKKKISCKSSFLKPRHSIFFLRQREMDALDTVVDPLRDFAKDSVRLVKRCHKPDRNEFSKVAFRTAIGFVVMGFVGFFVKLIFIPINNIIVGSA
ncbi:hypothetical protein GQ457_15G006780 [Hibiscus cannabinus]